MNDESDNHDIAELEFSREANISVKRMAEAAALCFPAANAVGSAMQHGLLDATLPEALRALAFAIEELTINQRLLHDWARSLSAQLSDAELS